MALVGHVISDLCSSKPSAVLFHHTGRDVLPPVAMVWCIYDRTGDVRPYRVQSSNLPPTVWYLFCILIDWCYILVEDVFRCVFKDNLAVEPIPLLALSTLHPQSPNALRCPGHGGRRRPGKRQTSSPSRELGDRRWPAGLEPGLEHWGLTLAKTVWVHPHGDVHFSQDYRHDSTLHPIALQWSDRAERKGFNPAKTRQKPSSVT